MSDGLQFPPIPQPLLWLQPPHLSHYLPKSTVRHVALVCLWVLQEVQALFLLLAHVQ